MEEALILDRAKYFRQTTVWPLVSKFDSSGWLSNFRDGEKKYAVRLLSNFIYFNKIMVESLFRSTFSNMSMLVAAKHSCRISANNEWQNFAERMLIVRVTGEVPNDTDSGFLFVRMARDLLGIPERQIVTPEEAIRKLRNGEQHNVIFVDDFSGLASQFTTTWFRRCRMSDGVEISFHDLDSVIKARCRFFYCPPVIAQKGLDEISSDCPHVIVCSAHRIGHEYSALNANGYIWKDDYKDEGPEFVEQVSRRLGIPESGGSKGDWRGYGCLALSLAFEHGWPDATLPIYSWDQDGWKPLLRKS